MKTPGYGLWEHKKELRNDTIADFAEEDLKFCTGETGKNIPYILESNLHPFYSFRGLKNQIRIRFAI
jgi:hypothetical protein